VEQIISVKSTGSGSIAVTVNPDGPFELIGLRLHLSAVGGAGSLTVTVDHGSGSAYDTLLYSVDMTSIADLSVPFEGHAFQYGDKIVIAWANAGSKTYGIEVVYRRN